MQMTQELALAEVDVLLDEERLRSTLETLLRFASFLGAGEGLVARLQQALNDPRSFQLILAIVQYLWGLMEPHEQPTGDVRLQAAGFQVEASAADFAEWLPFVFQLIELIRRLRNA